MMNVASPALATEVSKAGGIGGTPVTDIYDAMADNWKGSSPVSWT